MRNAAKVFAIAEHQLASLRHHGQKPPLPFRFARPKKPKSAQRSAVNQSFFRFIKYVALGQPFAAAIMAIGTVGCVFVENALRACPVTANRIGSHEQDPANTVFYAL